MSYPLPTVLVVEDEFLIRDYVSDHLRDAGFNVLGVGTVSQAIALFENAVPIDVVFTDITLPGDLDGFDLVRWIKARAPGVPIALTSGGHNAEKAAEICRDEPFFSKPYDHARVVACLTRLVQTSR